MAVGMVIVVRDFASPAAITRSLRLVTREQSVTSKAQRNPPDVYCLSPLADDGPSPNNENFSFVPPSPVASPYEMPLAGFAAVRIEDSEGRHVRRLIAEAERRSGMVLEPRDLLDDGGRYVPPGEYRFVGIARPKLKLTYEATVYNAGNPPWMAPVPGGGCGISICAVHGDTLMKSNRQAPDFVECCLRKRAKLLGS